MKLNFAAKKIKNKTFKCAIVKSMFASIPVFAQELPNSPEKVISEKKM